MLCTFVRSSGLPTIYINPLKVCVVEQSADMRGALITFDNGGSVIVEGSAETAAARIGEALKEMRQTV